MFIQTSTGFFLVLYYNPHEILAFDSIQYLIIEVFSGWLIRVTHFNFVSFFFFSLFLHFFKGFLYSSYRLKMVWFLGLSIIIVLMLVAFLGYTLVWSQISFWAATVITSLISVFPFFGGSLIFFIWGGFYLNTFSLKLFFFFHFVMPLLIFFLIFFHLIILHFYGSTNKLSNNSKLIKRTFYPFYWVKDLLNLILFFVINIFVILLPFDLNETLRYVTVNNLVSPVHIVPEWYFLWAYAILRAFPLKRLGVAIILLRIIIFFFMKKYFFVYRKILNFLNWFFLFNWIFLAWLGAQEPLSPYVFLALLFCFLYFFIIFLLISLLL